MPFSHEFYQPAAGDLRPSRPSNFICKGPMEGLPGYPRRTSKLPILIDGPYHIRIASFSIIRGTPRREARAIFFKRGRTGYWFDPFSWHDYEPPALCQLSPPVCPSWFRGSVVSWFRGFVVPWFRGSVVSWFRVLRICQAHRGRARVMLGIGKFCLGSISCAPRLATAVCV